MITALIIDDEEHNRRALGALIEAHCPGISLIGEAADADEAFAKITALRPRLIFLDIKMPRKSGFDLLRMLPGIQCEVIFVTAFDKYAIRAFEFNAIGYILKPVDKAKLVKVVSRAVEKIHAGVREDLVLHFVETLPDADNLVNRLSVHHNDRVVFIRTNEISCIEGGDGTTTICMADGHHFYSSKRLGDFEGLLEPTMNFIRVSKSVMINSNHIRDYTKGEPCIITMKNGQFFEVSRRRKSEILNRLKATR